MSRSSEVAVEMVGLQLLFEAIGHIGCALKDLRRVERELKQMQDCNGKTVEVDATFENAEGDVIGVKEAANGQIDLINQNPERSSVKNTMARVRQSYSRLKVLNEVKRKGYGSVKEEKLANGSIRLVVEKWR